jgi:hypothetical protein
MINATQRECLFAMAKVLAVSSANKGDNMLMDQNTCLGERQ